MRIITCSIKEKDINLLDEMLDRSDFYTSRSEMVRTAVHNYLFVLIESMQKQLKSHDEVIKMQEERTKEEENGKFVVFPDSKSEDGHIIYKKYQVIKKCM